MCLWCGSDASNGGDCSRGGDESNYSDLCGSDGTIMVVMVVVVTAVLVVMIVITNTIMTVKVPSDQTGGATDSQVYRCDHCQIFRLLMRHE